jgi:hypothetical protein
MKYRYNCYTRKIGDREEKYYCIEYNKTDGDYDSDWFELEDFTEDMCKDVAELLNAKYASEPYYKYKKSNNAYVYVKGICKGINERIAALDPIDPKDL